MPHFSVSSNSHETMFCNKTNRNFMMCNVLSLCTLRNRSNNTAIFDVKSLVLNIIKQNTCDTIRIYYDDA